jgi:large subunit ribosomal protein L9
VTKNVKLLLIESVDTLGIVGDVVNVRTGYARNFLLPRNLATTPTDEAIKSVAVKRAEAEKMLAELRKQRESMVQKMAGLEVTLVRSCNDQGILYGAITQQDIATALEGVGYHVKPREVRLGQTIKRIDAYDVHVKLDTDLDATVKVWVVADRKLDLEKAAAEAPVEQAPAEATEDQAKGAEDKAAKPTKGDKPEKGGKGEKSDKAEKAPKAQKVKKEKAPKADKSEGGEKSDAPKSTGGWGKVVDKGPDVPMPRPRRGKKDR